MTEQFKETNFESIDKEGAKTLIDNLPEFEITTEVDETDYQLGDIMFSDDGEMLPQNTPVMEQKKERLPARKSDSLEGDFDDSRQNLRELSARQAEILDNLFKLCKASDSPRAYEVLGQMIDRFTVLEEKMMELYLKKAKVEKEQKEDNVKQVASTINNNQYNVKMSTADMIKMMIEQEGEEGEDD
jgi:hypothetical protein